MKNMNRAAPKVLLGGLLGMACGTAFCGQLDAPAAPTSSGSAMVTLDTIYNKLNDRSTVVTKRTGTFAEPTAGPGATMHTLDEIMTLVTNRAPVQTTGQTTSYATGDDGDLELGVRWPVPRFTIGTVGSATNCVTDNLTGLMWTRDGNLGKPYISSDGKCTWAQAFDVITNAAGPVNGAHYGGYSDWRLPSIREIQSLSYYGVTSAPGIPNTQGTGKWAEADPFKGISGLSIWTSTTYAGDMTLAWTIALVSEFTEWQSTKTIATAGCVWAVRGGGN